MKRILIGLVLSVSLIGGVLAMTVGSADAASYSKSQMTTCALNRTPVTYHAPYNRGACVAAVQYILRRAGYGVAVDGVYGPDTYKKVKSYQSRHDLYPDGWVGNQTWIVLTDGCNTRSECAAAFV